MDGKSGTRNAIGRRCTEHLSFAEVWGKRLVYRIEVCRVKVND